MQLTGFRVQMYKSILDSKWVAVTPLTSLVGKNEVGKTSLLRALHKFNPFTPEPYDIYREWPRGHRDGRSKEQVVCTARFVLTPTEKTELSSLTEKPSDIAHLDITKNYAGEFEVQFPTELFPDRLHPNDIDTALQNFPQLPEPVGQAFRDAVQKCQVEARRMAAEGRFTDLASYPDQCTNQLNALRTTGNPQPQHNNENAYIGQFANKLREVGNQLKAAPTIHRKAHEFVIKQVPTFVYMDEYRVFRGSALLDQVVDRQRRNQANPEDDALHTILELAALDISDLVKKGTSTNETEKEERQYDLSDGAATLTNKVSSNWGQLKYEVQFQADGQQFFTFIKDPKDKALIRLEERSRGFQWFFSFDLLLMHQTKGSLKGCVILLDEPGLHLHPEGQQDLLRRLEVYAEGNTLIYSTHLPFMLDLQEPDRIRILSETGSGMVVTDDLTTTQPEGKLTLQAALGISGRTSFLVADQNLVVEGVDDYWLITALSSLAERSGKITLPEDLLITPAGGAAEVTYIATFMVGQELGAIALYDTDEAGTTARDKFVKKWLTRYNNRPAQALHLAEIWGVTGEASIEDLFPDEFYLSYVSTLHSKVLAAAGVDTITLLPGGQLVKRVEALFESKGLSFNKGSIAKRIAADIRKMPDFAKLPPLTATRAEQLLAAIALAAKKLTPKTPGT